MTLIKTVINSEPVANLLTIKQKLFIEHYLATRNGTRAAELAGYAGNQNTLKQVAAENLAKPYIRAEIDRRLRPFILSANQVLAGLSSIAENDIAEAFEADGSFNLEKAKERGVTRLIKSLNFDKDTGKMTKVELYSAHDGLRDLGKYHKLFTEKLEIRDPREDAQEAYRQILEEFPSLDPERAKIIVANSFGIDAEQLGTIG